jgi:hypothetical protein
MVSLLVDDFVVHGLIAGAVDFEASIALEWSGEGFAGSAAVMVEDVNGESALAGEGDSCADGLD